MITRKVSREPKARLFSPVRFFLYLYSALESLLAAIAIMKKHQLSAGKRLTKPVLFGTLIVGLATAFFNRHRFFEDVDELRAQERERNHAKRMEILERRQKQMEEMAEKKRGGSD